MAPARAHTRLNSLIVRFAGDTHRSFHPLHAALIEARAATLHTLTVDSDWYGNELVRRKPVQDADLQFDVSLPVNLLPVLPSLAKIIVKTDADGGRCSRDEVFGVQFVPPNEHRLTASLMESLDRFPDLVTVDMQLGAGLLCGLRDARADDIANRETLRIERIDIAELGQKMILWKWSDRTSHGVEDAAKQR